MAGFDWLAFLFSAIGGIAMGTYPVPIKAPSVVKADVHPVLFQCYKSFWVVVLGWIFVIYHAIIGSNVVLDYTIWGIVSAGAWIPSGLCTIASVPRLGVGLAVVLNTGSASVLSFLAGWLVLGENMKVHSQSGLFRYWAPYFLALVVLGMTALVCATYAKCGQKRAVALLSAGQGAVADEAPASQTNAPPSTAVSPLDQVLGLIFSIAGGFFSALQYLTNSWPKHRMQENEGCYHGGKPQGCSPELNDTFDAFGSWGASFSVGTAVVTTFFLLCFVISERFAGRPMPSLHFEVLRGPGSLAGVFWFIGMIFQTAAIVRGGTATMMPANYAFQLICSGTWGVVYYREVKSCHRILLWVAAAAWTLAAVVLLSLEKSH